MSEHQQQMEMMAHVITELQNIHGAVVQLAEAIAGVRGATATAEATKAVAKAKKSSRVVAEPQPEVGENTGSDGSGQPSDVPSAAESGQQLSSPPSEAVAPITLHDLMTLAADVAKRLSDKAQVHAAIHKHTDGKPLKFADVAAYPAIKAELETL